jgi:hypothetical protein
VRFYAFGVGASPAIVNLQVATFAPTMLLHSLSECGEAIFSVRIVSGLADEDPDPSHSVIGAAAEEARFPRR